LLLERVDDLAHLLDRIAAGEWPAGEGDEDVVRLQAGAGRNRIRFDRRNLQRDADSVANACTGL
jgi:hypothetical protein